jgi:IS1 family transposase
VGNEERKGQLTGKLLVRCHSEDSTCVTPKTSSEVFTQHKPICLGKCCKLPTKEIEDFNSNMRQKLKKTGFLEYFEKDLEYCSSNAVIG